MNHTQFAAFGQHPLRLLKHLQRFDRTQDIEEHHKVSYLAWEAEPFLDEVTSR